MKDVKTEPSSKTLYPDAVSLMWLRGWLPENALLHILSVGCSLADEAGLLLASDRVARFVGVDLDETAILEARERWPQATFVVGDAAQLGPEHNQRYHVVLIRRPDLFAQPERWRHVFERLPALLRPQARVLVSVIGHSEAGLAREWLVTNGLPVIHSQELMEPEETRLLVSTTTPQDSDKSKATPSRPNLKIIQLDEMPGEGFYCEPQTGLCYIDGKLVEDTSTIDGENPHDNA